MEAISDHPHDEAKFFDQQCGESEGTIYGFVAGIDMTKDISQELKHYKTMHRFCGVRHIFNFEPSWPKVDRNLLNDRQVRLNFFKLEEEDVTFDLQLNPHQFNQAALIL
jgi:predicted TIM-barrel fold metal-dependent hydrolase/uncharacterized protein involved in tolerance to divalent cations